MRQPFPNEQASAANEAPSPLSEESIWPLILQLSDRVRAGKPLMTRAGFTMRAGMFVDDAIAEADVVVDPHALSVQFGPSVCASSEAHSLCRLFLPMVVGRDAPSLMVGHLGQSLDGRVATPSGASQFITSREDIVHTHRLRAVFDAVIVGVRTVQLDDPQLTTRLVAGPHPTRVVLDPRGKLTRGFKVLEDEVTETLICTAPGHRPQPTRRGSVHWIGVRCDEEGFDPTCLREALAAHGLRRVFVEGGGVTVSRMLAAGMLDRLHVSVAPMILGSGAPSFALPTIDRLDEALRPKCRHFSLGPDVLFDCALPKLARAAE